MSWGWYHESFDKEQGITGLHVPPLELVCKDFHVCKWSAQLCDREDSLALYFDAMNDKQANVIDELKRKCINARSLSREKDAFVPKLSYDNWF